MCRVARQGLHLEKCDDSCTTAELNTVRSPFQACLQLLESCRHGERGSDIGLGNCAHVEVLLTGCRYRSSLLDKAQLLWSALNGCL